MFKSTKRLQIHTQFDPFLWFWSHSRRWSTACLVSAQGKRLTSSQTEEDFILSFWSHTSTGDIQSVQHFRVQQLCGHRFSLDRNAISVITLRCFRTTLSLKKGKRSFTKPENVQVTEEQPLCVSDWLTAEFWTEQKGTPRKTWAE